MTTASIKAKPRTSSPTAIKLLALVGLDADGSKLPVQENQPAFDSTLHGKYFS